MTTRRRERKVVSVLFCDLVGFTSRAEALDPEDVEAILRPYHARVREELERYGGTVEKFIGDAVMALFGAPVAHEDDPERAVRAALAIRDFATEEGLELRVGITTGEALVSLDASPAEGEGMASGDVVNTAARLQSAAPVNGVIADETTYRATRHAVDYRDTESVAAKGKSEQVPVWEAIEARARFGTEVLDHVAGDLVGRDRELTALRAAFDRVREESSSQLVTLVGVPGIGKSRLLYELSRLVDALPDLTTWRQGRCLAYGDGITFWALGEIVKAQAGIDEADDDATAAEKLRQAATEIVDAVDADWVYARLRPLAGLDDESELGGDRGGEAFAAWRRFFEELAAQRPLVLVFEDLQWADDGLLDFIDELVEWVTDLPLLVVCTARPELLARRPNWGGGKLNASTVALEPLSDTDTARLMSTLLERAVLSAEVQQTLLDRAGGNPLYAEQFAQLYVERGSADDLPLPETLQGIISARLDDLPGDEKALLHAGSVVGKVFWTGALNGDGHEIEPVVHALVRKGFLRRQRRSSVAGEVELAFAHALVRDVAYGQLPRAERAAKHRSVAEWLESLGRHEDHAEMLAHHWRSALELASASGSETSELEERTRLTLAEAGNRAFSLNAFPAAAKYYDDALALWPADGVERPALLFRLARALFIAGDERAERALAEARDVLVDAGDRAKAAEAEAFLAQGNWFRGDLDAVFTHLRSAEALIEGADPSPGATRVLAWAARYEFLDGDREGGLRRAEEALALADRFGLPDLGIHALTTIGSAKAFLGDATGVLDLERAVDSASAAGSPMVVGALNNLAVVLDTIDFRRCQAVQEAALHEAERFGDAQLALFLRGNLVAGDWILGAWDDALAVADELIAEWEHGTPNILEGATRQFRGFMRMARGFTDDAFDDFSRALVLGREAQRDPQAFAPALVRYAWACLRTGRVDEAHAHFVEAIPVMRRYPYTRPWTVSEVAVELGETAAVREILGGLPPTTGVRAMCAVLDGDFLAAADLYREAHVLLFEAEARLRAGEELAAAGELSEAEIQLEQALAFYRPVRATIFVERAEKVLAEAQSASA